MAHLLCILLLAPFLPLPGDVCRFDLSRIPLTCLASSGPDIYHSPEDVVEWQGVAWGTDAWVCTQQTQPL